ncbi:MAG: hypothetical protein NVSMB1_15310 [Polyangiales bacterium]
MRNASEGSHEAKQNGVSPRWAHSLALAMFLATIVTLPRAHADPAVQSSSEQVSESISESPEHGSQAASSDWLPIVMGASAGVAVGALVGNAADPLQPATWGTVLGGAVGALAGGGGGGWLIRSMRDADTRLAGTVTGGALGLGAGLVMMANTESTYGKIPAVILLPLMGAVIGNKLAFTFSRSSGPGARPGDHSFTPVSLHAIAAPLPAAHSSAPSTAMGGLTIGIGGVFF